MSDIITALRAIVAPGSTHYDVRLSRKDIIKLLEVVDREPSKPTPIFTVDFSRMGYRAMIDALQALPDGAALYAAAPAPVTQPSKTEEQK